MADRKSDSRDRVAFEMAMMMWNATHRGEPPKMDQRQEFLTLVGECSWALEQGSRPPGF